MTLILFIHFYASVIGLKMLKIAYNEYATIQHTIDYYIIIIMQKNTNLILKMGFTNLDIENSISLDNNTLENNNTLEKINNIEKPSNIEKNTTINTIKNKKNGNIESIENNNNINSIFIDSNKNNDSIKSKDIRDSIVLTKMSNNEKKDIQLKDMHKFLFELWSERELNIVINLYKEMENKSKGYERDNIYSNIMSYCSMKENKLYKYIEENSSIL